MELRSICDSIAIVAAGKVVRVFGPDAADAEIGLAMSGIKSGEVGAI
jgi:simple sugar transport system ATP-binding protein